MTDEVSQTSVATSASADQPAQSSAAPTAAPDNPEIVVDAVYQRGVIKPETPLDLPANTPLLLRITPRVALNVERDGTLPIIPISIALVLGALGQYAFLSVGDFTIEGLVLYVLAMLVFTLAVTKRDDPTQRAAENTVPGTATEPGIYTFSWRWGLTGVALVIGLWLIWTLYAQRLGAADPAPVLPWVVAIGLVMIAWMRLPALPSYTAVSTWLRSHSIEVAAVAGIVLVGGGLRLWNLGGWPYALSGDEGSIGVEIRRLMQGEIRNPFVLAWGPLPTFSYFMQSIPSWFVGLDAWSLRLVNALFGTAAIAMLYVLVRLLFNTPVALAAAIVLAGYQVQMHYSRATINVIFDTFFYPAALAALIYGLRFSSRRSAFVLAGVLAGLAQYTNVGARLLPILIVAFLCYLYIFAPSWLRGQRDNLLVLLTAFLITAGPMIVFAVQHPDDYNARINQIGAIQSGWLEREQIARNEGPVWIFLDQFKRALLGYVVYEDKTDSYDGGTLANPAMAVLLFLGLAVSIYNWQKPVFALLLLWFFGALIGGGVLTVNPPTSHRQVMLTPVAALFTAIALWEIVRLLLASIGGGGNNQRRWALAGVAVVAVAVVVPDVRFYFREYLPSHRFGNVHAYVATELGYRLQQEDSNTHLYFLGPPRMWSNFSTLVFLAPHIPSTDVIEPVQGVNEVRQLVQTDSDALFFFLPERIAEVNIVRQAFPDGRLVEVLSPVHSTEAPIFLLYRVPQENIGQGNAVLEVAATKQTPHEFPALAAEGAR